MQRNELAGNILEIGPMTRWTGGEALTVPEMVNRLDFFVSRDRRGSWLAVETHGQAVGFFCSRRCALRYVARVLRVVDGTHWHA